MRTALWVLGSLAISGCVARRPAEFRVVPASPAYLLRAPDSQETPFPDVLARFTPSNANWVDLEPLMDLRIENAYYREGAVKHDLGTYLGTEVARYATSSKGGLQLLAVESGVPQQPADQPTVQTLIPPSIERYRFHRFFYEVLFRQRKELRGAVLLGAATAKELDGLTSQLLADPASVCGGRSAHCTVFPESCIVSLEIEITVNGARQSVPWGSLLMSLAAHPNRLELLRLYSGHPTPVAIDPADPAALRLPLLPGDRISLR